MKKAEVRVGQEYLVDTGYGHMEAGVAIEHGWGYKGYSWRRELERGFGSGVLFAFPRPDYRGGFTADLKVVQLNKVHTPRTVTQHAADRDHAANARLAAEALRRRQNQWRADRLDHIRALMQARGLGGYVSEYTTTVEVSLEKLVELLGGDVSDYPRAR